MWFRFEQFFAIHVVKFRFVPVILVSNTLNFESFIDGSRLRDCGPPKDCTSHSVSGSEVYPITQWECAVMSVYMQCVMRAQLYASAVTSKKNIFKMKK